MALYQLGPSQHVEAITPQAELKWITGDHVLLAWGEQRARQHAPTLTGTMAANSTEKWIHVVRLRVVKSQRSHDTFTVADLHRSLRLAR